jgi:hypothetical protein
LSFVARASWEHDEKLTPERGFCLEYRYHQSLASIPHARNSTGSYSPSLEQGPANSGAEDTWMGRVYCVFDSSHVGTKEALRVFSHWQEAHMDRPKMRNEFGLDKDNALDVQKEAAKGMVPWVLGAIALLAVVGLLMFGLPHTTSKTADLPSSPTTTGAATNYQGKEPRTIK